MIELPISTVTLVTLGFEEISNLQLLFADPTSQLQYIVDKLVVGGTV